MNVNNHFVFIVSSQYASAGGLYVLCGNYNQVGTLVRLVASNVFSVSVTHKSNGVDTIHVTTNNNYSWYVISF